MDQLSIVKSLDDKYKHLDLQPGVKYYYVIRRQDVKNVEDFRLHLKSMGFDTSIRYLKDTDLCIKCRIGAMGGMIYHSGDKYHTNYTKSLNALDYVPKDGDIIKSTHVVNIAFIYLSPKTLREILNYKQNIYKRRIKK